MIRTALIDGVTFNGKAVQYAEVDGMAIFESDICLGRVEDVEADNRGRAPADKTTPDKTDD